MKIVTAGLAVAAMLAFQACRSAGALGAGQTPVIPSETVGEAGVVTIRAWVDAIDKTNRTVTLKGPRGGTVTLDVKDPTKLDAMAVARQGIAVQGDRHEGLQTMNGAILGRNAFAIKTGVRI